MPPFPLPKSTKIASKPYLGRHRFFDGFPHWYFLDCCSILEANLAPCWPLFRFNRGGPCGIPPLFNWAYVLFRFFGCPDAILAPFWLHLGGYGPHLGSILEVVWTHFGTNFCAQLPLCWAFLAQELTLDGRVKLAIIYGSGRFPNDVSGHYLWQRPLP